MQNFQRIISGLDTSPLLHCLATQPELWNQHTVRTGHPESAHRVVDDIILRYSKFNSGDDFIRNVCCEIQCYDYPAWYKLPQAQYFVFLLMQKVLGVHLGRVMITRVRPGVQIGLHSDRIAQAEEVFPNVIPPAVYYERYHLALQSGPGCSFICGDEQVSMAPGELWWFNNQIPHTVINNSAVDRLHLIIDIRTRHDDYIPS